MKANYYNWMPKSMVYGFASAAGTLALGAAGLGILGKGKAASIGTGLMAVGAIGCSAWAAYSKYAYDQFSYDGKRKLSKQIIDGIAEYITLPEGGVGLDVGCGSGALTIACAKRNPQGRMVGIDKWGPEYADFSKQTCEKNAIAEEVKNTEFRIGNAIQLPFDDEAFDAVTSNYVYHNIMGKNKQELLLETLRTLKKGGCFAIHDLMSKVRYGDMEAFRQKLLGMGYEKVELIDTTDGKFMSRSEAFKTMLSGSTLLVGIK